MPRTRTPSPNPAPTAAPGTKPVAAPLSRTGRALVEAAKRLIATGRMDTATIEDIAREAEVAKRSFHNQFRDREALLEHVMTEVRDELEAAIALVNREVDDPAIRFTRGMLVSFRYSLDIPVGARVMLRVAAGAADPRSPRNLQLAQALRDGMARGALKLAHVDTGVVLILGLSDVGVARLMPLHDQRPRALLLMRSICTLMLRSLGVDGRRIDRVIDDGLRTVFGADAVPEPQLGARGARR